MHVRVIEPGPLTTVQDLGRRGYQDRGFSPSGAMDWRAATLANALLGNDAGAAVLEFALMGPTLRFEGPAVVALAGADMPAELDGRPLAPYQATPVAAGSVLSVGAARHGQFGYLAFAGGVGTEPVMGSRSTSLRYGLGGVGGRRLEEGDDVPLALEGVEGMAGIEERSVHAEDAFYGWAGAHTWVRVVPGDERLFDQESVEAFYSEPFTVTGKSDRMGFRLAGPTLRTSAQGGIVSEGVALGTVQVPAHGQPIVMLADHQTTGGYPKMGVVATCDIPRLVQSPPGRTVRFERVSVEEAQALLRTDVAYLDGLARRWGRAANWAG